MFSNGSTFLQFASYKPFVQRPYESSPENLRYIQATVIHTPSVMVCRCISSKGIRGLCFLPSSETMHALQYFEVLGGHLLNFKEIQGATVFQHDSCHKAKIVTKWLQTPKSFRFTWQLARPKSNRENLWAILKKRS